MEVIRDNQLLSFNKGDNEGKRWNERNKYLTVVFNRKKGGNSRVNEIMLINFLFFFKWVYNLY